MIFLRAIDGGGKLQIGHCSLAIENCRKRGGVGGNVCGGGGTFAGGAGVDGVAGGSYGIGEGSYVFGGGSYVFGRGSYVFGRCSYQGKSGKRGRRGEFRFQRDCSPVPSVDEELRFLG